MINSIVSIITVLRFSVTTQDGPVLSVIQEKGQTVLTPQTLPSKHTVRDHKERGRRKQIRQRWLV